MNLHEVIATRRTVQKFRAGTIPRAVLDRAIEAAHWAPNHKLTFPWRFTIVGEKTRAALAAVSCEMKEKKDGALSDDTRKSITSSVMTPGALIAVTCVKSPDPARNREDYAAVACATQNLMLSLWDSGFGTKWGTGALTRLEKTFALLGIDGAKEEMVGFIYAGVPEFVPPAPPRPPFRDFVREVE